MHYDWGYHSSESEYVHVSRVEDGAGRTAEDYATKRREDLFDVTLYDREVIDPKSGVNCEEQSLRDLRELIGYANAAIKAGLTPEPVADRT